MLTLGSETLTRVSRRVVVVSDYDLLQLKNRLSVYSVASQLPDAYWRTLSTYVDPARDLVLAWDPSSGWGP